ncbi:efflux RND transporter periplasmic adaptor subunit [Geoalkalibacter halelectricus]|uniref:efflux RND transporter periplasmic adaptor subunit n=1 Tax=Geoalkalibacter halelectricus TaxID=2847045 RepID=UPI003D1AD006
MVMIFRGVSFLLLLPLLWSCEQQPVAPEEPLRTVRTQTVVRDEGVRVRSFSGTARPAIETRLSFRVPGTLVDIPVKVGDQVRRGSLVAALDPADYQLQVREAEAALAEAAARTRNAEAHFERVRALYENNHASLTDLDAARAGAESARAAEAAAAMRVELAQLQLGYTRLRAPLDGEIAAVRVEVNENVAAGAEVVVLTASQFPEVAVALPEALIGAVARGEEVRVSFDAIPGEGFAGVVTEVGVAASHAGATFPVTVRLLAPDRRVRQGMSAEVVFRFAPHQEVARMLVPAAAVGEDQQGRFVFVVEPGPDDTTLVRRRAVEVGALRVEGLEILSGLTPGEQVVTAGVSRIEDGQRVLLAVAEERRP